MHHFHKTETPTSSAEFVDDDLAARDLAVLLKQLDEIFAGRVVGQVSYINVLRHDYRPCPFIHTVQSARRPTTRKFLESVGFAIANVSATLRSISCNMILFVVEHKRKIDEFSPRKGRAVVTRSLLSYTLRRATVLDKGSSLFAEAFMPISFSCPKCRGINSVPPERTGEKVRCGRCRAEIVVPFPKPVVLDRTDSVSTADRPSSGIRFRCGACHARNEVDQEWAGKQVRCGSCGIDLLVPGIERLTTHAAGASLSRAPRVFLDEDSILENNEEMEEETPRAMEPCIDERNRPVSRLRSSTPVQEPDSSANFWLWATFAGILIVGVTIGVVALVSAARPLKPSEPSEGRLASDAPKKASEDSPMPDAKIAEDRPELPSPPRPPDRSLENDPDAQARARSAYYKENALWVDKCAGILTERYRFDQVFRVTFEGLDQPEERDAILEALRGCLEGMNGSHAEALVSDRAIRAVFAPAPSLAAFTKGLEFGRPIQIEANENDLTITLSRGSR